MNVLYPLFSLSSFFFRKTNGKEKRREDKDRGDGETELQRIAETKRTYIIKVSFANIFVQP